MKPTNIKERFKPMHMPDSQAVSLEPSVFLITGIMASGKSTVAQLLAERLPRSVHVRGDAFRRMIVNGREEYMPNPSDEAVRQLRLRYRIAASTADAYRDAGFNVVVQDVVLGPELKEFVGWIRSRPLYVIVLTPDPEAVAAREAARGKQGYGPWTVAALDRILREETPDIGLRLDTTHLTAEATVSEILSRAWTEAAV